MESCTRSICNSRIEEESAIEKPTLLLGDGIDWRTAVDYSFIKLVVSSCEHIVEDIQFLHNEKAPYQSMGSAVTPYGDSKPSGRIVQALRQLVIAWGWML